MVPLLRAAVPIDPILLPEGAPTATGRVPGTGDNRSSQQTAAAEYSESNIRITLMGRIINALLAIAGSVAIFFILNNAWYLVISAGREETITQYKKGLTWAIIGLILVILSYSIVRFIISIAFQAD